MMHSGTEQKKSSLPCTVLALLLLTAVLSAVFFGVDAVRERMLKRAYPTRYEEFVIECSEKYGLEASLILAVIRCESGFRPDAVSRAGAVGLMQIMPDTGAWIAEKLFWPDYSEDFLLDPARNIEAGCWYLAFLRNMFGNDLRIVCAAYNAGQGTVGRWLSDVRYFRNGKLLRIPYPETAAYVERVLSSEERYRQLYPEIY